MLAALIHLIFLLVIAGVVYWAAQQLLALIPTAEPFTTLIRVVMVIILVVIVLYAAAELLGAVGIRVY